MRLIQNIAIVLLILVCGCSRTTMREIGEAHKADIEAVLAEFRTLAESIPMKDFDPETTKLDLEPYVHVADPMSNTAMGSKDQLLGTIKPLKDLKLGNPATFSEFHNW